MRLPTGTARPAAAVVVIIFFVVLVILVAPPFSLPLTAFALVLLVQAVAAVFIFLGVRRILPVGAGFFLSRGARRFGDSGFLVRDLVVPGGFLFRRRRLFRDARVFIG